MLLILMFYSTTSAFAQLAPSAVPMPYVNHLPLQAGSCPTIDTQPPLDLEKKAGIWYEVQRSKSNYDGADRCAKVSWGKPVNGTSIVIDKSASNLAPVTERTVMRVSLDAQGTGFIYNVPILGNIFMNHQYLDIDYKSHVIVWTCINYGRHQHIETSWILTRRPRLPSNIETVKRYAFRRYHLPVPEMVTHNLTGCGPFYSSRF